MPTRDALWIVGSTVAPMVAFVFFTLRALVLGSLVTKREHGETRSDRDRAVAAAEKLAEVVRVQSETLTRIAAAVDAQTRQAGEMHALIRSLADRVGSHRDVA